ncbi:hypothetical protein C8Q69DRAFT_244815 [Paecilomyces variotii]|uniref:Uncharacterized protein n=1 Tax=Byssochlamys spectabilis TaxID=264951 RepID=A0A443HX73_BYSSP|nr:hypothetical protein C8Q69DRAFT_244815 [Paecilomyces variotii]KAJ9226794.1 hypothetical protein DTO169C6_1034 [Paecilomyces variotii]KAJ9259621.1 hypothetical protein DTO195F2_4965 [Paecilomyces variotii]KAJ9327482.1 hypothetical protein DTO027B3_1704 [Paecilomyces variotii]KAJ9334972.1 hypothetical protein DTO027B5_3189 [Paecilomyces variotii]KAJ9361329.1 hypothetical protein DTO280E4_3803 [Paecilomyces variotii]
MEPSQQNQRSDRPGTPPRPPYSPVTPVLAHIAPVQGSASIVPPDNAISPTNTRFSFNQDIPPGYGGGAASSSRPPTFVPEPAPVPISESENPDAIALRSALTVLQLQKQQSVRDIRALEQIKRAAGADPEGFARELAAGNLVSKGPSESIISFTDDDDDGNETSEAAKDQSDKKRSNFGKIPPPQNVVRMPPINWAKYQIVGEPLDKLHEEQQRRPSPGEPRREEPVQRAPEHVLAAPYRPLVDKIETPAKVRAGSKAKKT